MSANDSRSNLLGQAEPLATGDTGLPYPWQCLFDDEYQAYYYFNPLTDEQQWADINEDMDGIQVEHSNNPNEYDYQDFNEDGSTYLDELDGESISNVSRTSSVFERSTQMLVSKKEREEALRLELQLREEKELRAGPEINKRSKQMSRNVDDMLTWEEKRKQKMEFLAQKRRAEEASQNTGKPILYSYKSNSNASVSTTGSGESSSAALPVEERLMAYEEKRRLKLQQTIAQEKSEARKASIPTIAPHSANLTRRRIESYSTSSSTGSGSGSNRSWTSSSSAAAGGNTGILRDHSTGQIMFKPKLNTTSQRIASQSRPSTVPIEELLTGKGLLQQQRQAEKEARQQQRDQAIRQISKVNPKSERLMQERYILQGETTQDRLQRSIGNVKSKTLEEIERPTFKPSINPNSAEIASAASGHQFHYNTQDNGNVGGREGYLSPNQAYFEKFHQSTHNTHYGDEGSEGGESAYGSTDGPLLYEDLIRHSGNHGNAYTSSSNQQGQGGDAMFLKAQRWETSRQQKIEKERKERERKEKEICTFKPKIDSTRRGRPAAGRGSAAGGSYMERQESWVERREQKLEAERRRAAEKELEGCSFAPAMRTSAAPAASSGASQAGKRNKGTSGREHNREAPYDLNAEGSVSEAGAYHRQVDGDCVYTEEDAPAPPSARIPLPSKSTVPQNQTSSMPQLTNQRHLQPSKVSIVVPSAEENYSVDYEPSPSSGVMLARTALSQPAHHNLQFDQYWAQQQELERQEQQLQDGVEYGLEESDISEAHAKQLFASPPYYKNERTTTTTAAAATLEALRSYPYDSLMEPDDQDFGALSLADVADTTELPSYQLSHASEVDRAATVVGDGRHIHPPPTASPYYASEEEYCPPPPPPVCSTETVENAYPRSQPPYRSSSSRNVRFVSSDIPTSATAPGREDVMQGVEFSPSPVKLPRNAMYDML